MTLCCLRLKPLPADPAAAGVEIWLDGPHGEKTTIRPSIAGVMFGRRNTGTGEANESWTMSAWGVFTAGGDVLVIRHPDGSRAKDGAGRCLQPLTLEQVRGRAEFA